MTGKFAFSTTWLTWLMILMLGFSLAACSSPEERARAHYQSGMELMKAGEFVKASLEFRTAIKYDEKLADAWFGLANAEEQKQNWPVVADSLLRVAELDPKNVDAAFKLAKLQFGAMRLDEALKNANTANDLRKDDTNILALRAAILFRLNDREGARADAERALSLNPNNPEALALLAADEMAAKNTVGALRFIDRGLLADPNNVGLLLFKMKIFEDDKDYVKFEAALRQLVALNPKMKEARRTLLAFLSDRKRTADVETELRKWLADDPTDTASALELVRFVSSVRGAKEARKELENLIAANPSITDYKLALAQLDFSEKQTGPAIAALEAIIAKGEPVADVLRARLLLAGMSMQMGQVDRAKALINDVLTGDAKNADALALRATISLDAGAIDGAVADLREALNQRPNSAPLMILLGQAHERQGAVALANERLAQAVKASNYAPQTAQVYISFLERRGQKEQAEIVLNEAVARNPKDVGLLKTLAQLRLNKQDWVGAQAAADALKKIGDTSGVSERVAGVALLGEKKFDEGIEALKGAYTSAPEAVQPMYALYVAYLQAGKTSEAETFLQSILSANANNADAHVLMGSLKLVQKLPLEAEASFKRAIERQPQNPVGYVALSKHYLSLGKVAEAEAFLRSGREKAPQDLGINLLYTSLLESRNDIEGAIGVYEEQLKSTPDALIVINNLASLLADYRTDAVSLSRASQLAQRLEAIEVPQFKDTVGWVAYRSGDYRGALKNLEDAAEKLPDLALVKYHLAMTYSALKRNADAKEHLAKAEALVKGDDPLKEKIHAAIEKLAATN